MPMRIAFSGLLCLCAAAAAGAATEPRTLPAPPVTPPPASPITDHFALRATYYQPSISTDGRFDADTGALGTPFNGEQDLGLDDVANQGRIELLFRMRERHRLRADYFKLERFAGSRLTRDINFRNTTYRLGDFVETNFDWRMLGFTYSYSGWRSERLEFGLGLGLHLIEAETRAVVRARNIRESGSGVGVLPTIELDGTWRISRRWSVNGRAQYLKVNASSVDGTFGDYHFDAQYRWRRNVAFGLGYGATRLDAIVTDADLPGQLDISASGPELFFRVSF
ncbi:MAG: hypothetical protein U1F11_08165 [Steroidobacteraceae bacterium]